MMPTPFPATLRVRPLPWPTIDLLSLVMRKLAHDLTNSLVVSVSMVDLTAMRNHDAAVDAQLQRLRTHVMRPRDTIQCAIAALPGLGDRPRTLPALRTALTSAADEQDVLLAWLAPDDVAELPAALTETEWCHVFQALVQNALDAHATAALDEGFGVPRRIEVLWQDARLEVVDNGPGCTDLAAAASGRLQRAGQGHLGLGLSVVAALAERKGGSLHIGPADPVGFRAVFELPT